MELTDACVMPLDVMLRNDAHSLGDGAYQAACGLAGQANNAATIQALGVQLGGVKQSGGEFVEGIQRGGGVAHDSAVGVSGP
jgi:hypothetical protein